MSGYSDKPQATLAAPVSDEANAGSGAERRTSPRYPFSAAAEIVEVRSKARVAGRSSDVGFGGCYVDTISPFPVGAVVSVRLEHNQLTFEAGAVVTYALASMGMGISFTEIQPEQLAILQAWVAELTGKPLAIPEPPQISESPATPPEDDPLATISNLRQVMNEFINLMIRKKIITENEGAGLLRQLFR
jgi:PilZ domain